VLHSPSALLLLLLLLLLLPLPACFLLLLCHLLCIVPLTHPPKPISPHPPSTQSLFLCMTWLLMRLWHPPSTHTHTFCCSPIKVGEALPCWSASS